MNYKSIVAFTLGGHSMESFMDNNNIIIYESTRDKGTLIRKYDMRKGWFEPISLYLGHNFVDYIVKTHRLEISNLFGITNFSNECYKR